MRTGFSFAKGIGTGMAAGMMAAMVGSAMLRNRKSVKRTANKAAKAVSEILDDVQYILK